MAKTAAHIFTVCCTWVLVHAEPHAVDEVLTVHVVPHTHDDVGWLKTVDEYYTGQNNSIQYAYVKLVLDTVVRSLAENANRTFTYVEVAFFERWWRQQGQAIKDLTRRLVKSGQLEFSNGGWCMHDEAAPFYMDMIDQTTLGHKFLMEQFGVRPKTGWQIDPFGHSATQAALLSAEVGFEGLFFGRIDYQDLELRKKTKSAEFIWRASPSLGANVQVFSGLTGEYGGNYGPPEGFDWNEGSHDQPVQDDRKLEDYNVKSRVEDFVKAAKQQGAETRGKHVMFTMGSDFQYSNALSWFENLDRIIKYVNIDGRVHARYSTPWQYLQAKKREAVTWPLKTDDFFPYADGPHQFWTGYFTSRPALKRYVRESGAFFRIAQQLAVLGNSNSEADQAALEKLWEEQAVVQHHDAVAGTAKQHVTFDYAKRVAAGRAASTPVAAKSIAKLSGKATPVMCDLLNVSVCAPTQSLGDGSNRKQCFSLWNGLGHARKEIVELPVGTPTVVTLAATGTRIPSQLVTALPSVTNYGQPAGGGLQSIIFVASLPPLGFDTYCLETDPGMAEVSQQAVLPDVPVLLENDYLALEFCNNSLCKITNKETGVAALATQSWLWYNASVGNNESGQASGAYIFRPNSSKAFPVFSGTPKMHLARGVVADEVHQTFGPWVSQRVRLGKDSRHVEITYTVGPINSSDGLGKEIVSRIVTNLRTSGQCLTDSNGREMLQRKRDYRPSWKMNQTEPVAGNYYPVTTALAIRDAHAQLTMLTDASQAGTGCVTDGEIELMTHRCLLRDDSRGVGEPLNETEFATPYVGDGPQGQHYGPGLVTRGKHLLLLDKPDAAAASWRPLVDRLHMAPLPFFYTGAAAAAPATASYSALMQLPKNVELVTLAWWNTDQILLRLAHQFGVDEDVELSKPVTLDIGQLFNGQQIVALEERGLSVTSSRSEVLQSRIPWQVEGEQGKLLSSAGQPDQATTQTVGSTTISLSPLQIRTFLVRLATAPAELLMV